MNHLFRSRVEYLHANFGQKYDSNFEIQIVTHGFPRGTPWHWKFPNQKLTIITKAVFWRTWWNKLKPIFVNAVNKASMKTNMKDAKDFMLFSKIYVFYSSPYHPIQDLCYLQIAKSSSSVLKWEAICKKAVETSLIFLLRYVYQVKFVTRLIVVDNCSLVRQIW